MKKLISLFLILSQLIPATTLAAISVPDLADVGAPKNYIQNGGGERGAATWVCSGTGTPVVTAPATTPYEGNASLQIDLKSTVGNYCETAFTVPSARVEMWVAKLKYRLNSGAVADGNIKIDLMDATNGAVIPLAPGTLPGVAGSLWTPWQGEVQTPYNATSFKLRFTRVAGSGVIGVDALTLGTSAKSYGAPVTDWKSYTPTFAGLGTVTVAFAQYRQVGDTVELRGRITTGTTSGAIATIGLPPGLALAGDGSSAPAGEAFTNNGTVPDFHLMTDANSFATALTFARSNSAWAGNEPGTAIGDSKVIGWYAKTRITGWSSSTVMSSDAATSVVAMRAIKSTGSHTLSGSNQDVTGYDAVTLDKLGMMNATTGIATVKVPGTYRITTSYGFVGNSTGTRSAGLSVTSQGSTSSYYLIGIPAATIYESRGSGSILLDLFAGDTVKMMTYQNSGGDLAYDYATMLQIERLSGSQQIAASASVTLTATKTSNYSAANGAVDLTYDTKTDSHGMLNASTGVVTIPESGTYDIGVYVLLTGTLNSLESVSVVTTAGTTLRNLGRANGTIAAITDPVVSSSTRMRFLAGEQFKINVNRGNVNAMTIYGNSDGYGAYLTVTRVGNY